MPTNRLEAFSDGVIAIIITIMVLELKVPHGVELAALKPSLPIFLNYVLSFVYVGIYWNNHHHLLHAVRHVSAAMMWANLHLLFWLSLIPFATGWMGENHFAALPTALYGCVLLMAGVAYLILQNVIVAALGSDWKGKLSLAGFVAAIGLAFVNQWLSDALYVVVAAMWLIPDRRVEHAIRNGS